MVEKPTDFPRRRADGGELRPLPDLLLHRRATRSFKPDPVPDEYLRAILALGTQAPSGYNLQPWRFIVVREAPYGGRFELARVVFDEKDGQEWKA